MVDPAEQGLWFLQLALLKDLVGGQSARRRLSIVELAQLLVDARSLASSSAAHSCAPRVLSAVGFGPSANPVVGAKLRTRWRRGVVRQRSSASGDPLDQRSRLRAGRDRAQVLSVETTNDRLTALLALDGPTGAAPGDGVGRADRRLAAFGDAVAWEHGQRRVDRPGNG